MLAILLIHAAATLFMVGLIWFVQLVHYPLMSTVGQGQFAEFEALHARRTSWVVAPPMLVELALALYLGFRPPDGVPAAAAWTACGLVGLVWCSTAFVQVPLHRRLAVGFDAEAHRLLVASNWLRTIAWSARGVLSLAWLT